MSLQPLAFWKPLEVLKTHLVILTFSDSHFDSDLLYVSEIVLEISGSIHDHIGEARGCYPQYARYFENFKNFLHHPQLYSYFVDNFVNLVIIISLNVEEFWLLF
jgi:hypothetical protein